MMIASIYEMIKDGIRETGLADPTLHLLGGTLIYLVSALFARRFIACWKPVALVALIEGFNETMDRLHYGSWRWDDTLDDIEMTLMVPLALFGSTLLLIAASRVMGYSRQSVRQRDSRARSARSHPFDPFQAQRNQIWTVSVHRFIKPWLRKWAMLNG